MQIMFPPSEVRCVPSGEQVDFGALCRKAGMKCIVSANNLPDVRIHSGSVDFKAVAPGKAIFCLSTSLLSGNIQEKARQILFKLAYQFHDWAAREVVAAYRRDEKRRIPENAEKLRNALAPTPLKIFLHVRENGRDRVGNLASDLGIAQPHVSRAIRTLEEAGMVVSEQVGREVFVRPISKPEIDDFMVMG
jgi:DNA-binding transcriptional ArsR family regulator